MSSKSMIVLSLLLLLTTCYASTLETSSHWRRRSKRCGLHWGGCRREKVCVKARWYRKCVRPRNLGRKCGTHYRKVCAAHLKCIRHRCSKIMPAGGQCSDPYWICSRHTTCNGNICTKTVGAGARCEGRGLVCSTGLSCVGTPGRKVCKKLMDLGGQCSDPYWVCRDGLTCNGNICTRVVGYRVKCSLPTIVCQPGQGLDCVGNRKGYYCLKLMGEGGSCIDPWWRCRPHLVCKREGYKRICRRY